MKSDDDPIPQKPDKHEKLAEALTEYLDLVDEAVTQRIPDDEVEARLREQLGRMRTVGVTDTGRRAPIRGSHLIELARDLLGEASQLHAQEQPKASEDPDPATHATLSRIEEKLHRAQNLLHERPGTAMAIVQEVLRELEELAIARHDTTRTT